MGQHVSNYTRASSTREQITGEIIFIVKRNPEWKHYYFYMYFYNDQSRLSEQSLIVERNLVLAIHHHVTPHWYTDSHVDRPDIYSKIYTSENNCKGWFKSDSESERFVKRCQDDHLSEGPIYLRTQQSAGKWVSAQNLESNHLFWLLKVFRNWQKPTGTTQ